MSISHLPELKRQIQNVIKQNAHEKFPKVIHYNEGMEFPQFKITIEKEETDTFIDASGNKWKKVK